MNYHSNNNYTLWKPFKLALNLSRVCLCNPPMAIIEKIQRKKPSCRTFQGINCRKNRHCGRGGICTIYKQQRCKRPRYDGLFEMIEEKTGPNMEMDIEEYGTDLDYGNTKVVTIYEGPKAQ